MIRPDAATIDALAAAVRQYRSIHAATLALKLSRGVIISVLAGHPIREGSLLQVREQLRFAKEVSP